MDIKEIFEISKTISGEFQKSLNPFVPYKTESIYIGRVRNERQWVPDVLFLKVKDFRVRGYREHFKNLRNREEKLDWDNIPYFMGTDFLESLCVVYAVSDERFAGEILVAGLGLGLIIYVANKLKPGMCRFTIVEINRDLIQWHKQYNPYMKDVCIIEDDIYSYRDEKVYDFYFCDVLDTVPPSPAKESQEYEKLKKFVKFKHSSCWTRNTPLEIIEEYKKAGGVVGHIDGL